MPDNKDLDYSNNLKREREKKECIKREVLEMRRSLPVYSIEEIREHKMPYAEALLINLKENGFNSTASFIQELIDFQTKARDHAGVGSNIWLRPQLMNSKGELKILGEGLRESEVFNKEGEYDRECRRFLKLAIYFAFSHPDWWWLGEQLLIQSIRTAVDYNFEDAPFEMVGRFAYGKFLIENVREYDNAVHHLIIARELCTRKAYSLRYYFPDLENPLLYMQINYYTYLCHIREATSLMKVDYRKAAEKAILARKSAADACYTEGETKALLLKGQCALNLFDSKTAVLSFHKALKLQEKVGSMEGICQVMIQLAKAYFLDRNAEKAFKVLLDLRDVAEDHRLYYYLSQAYKNLGEFYLNNGEPRHARQLLEKSCTIFENHVSDQDAEINKIRLLEAIATGLDLFSKYLGIMNNPYHENFPGVLNITKLMAWKDTRESFWDSCTGIDPGAFIMNMKHETTESTTSLIVSEHKKRPKTNYKEEMIKSVMTGAIGKLAQRIGIDTILIVHEDMVENSDEVVVKSSKEHHSHRHTREY